MVDVNFVSILNVNRYDLLAREWRAASIRAHRSTDIVR
jgi:hypothetical protein